MFQNKLPRMLFAFICLMFPVLCLAQSSTEASDFNLSDSLLAWFALGTFVIAYLFVILEEFLHLRKSKPVVLAAGLIWAMVAFAAQKSGHSEIAEHLFKENLQEYTELFLFLLVAMTYINVMEDRRLFAALRCTLVSRSLSYKQIYWVTGILAFFISAWADNLTTALLMCTVVLCIGKDSPKFITLSAISIVIAANAGGAFSPFGDITTLMVWQKGIIDFFGFFKLIIPSIISYLVPAVCIAFAVPSGKPEAQNEQVALKPGAYGALILFVFTILLAVSSHLLLNMPPVLGMMTGFGLLKIYGYYLRHFKDTDKPLFDIFTPVANAEWDTLLFFYGVMLCVGGLAAFGHLELVSHYLYTELGQNLSPGMQALPANVLIGFMSAIVDNIPVMYAVLTMHPHMPEGQWLLVTLTAGTGGSLLAIGSAAGVALLGQARGYYTFFNHLRWSWAILLGYAASIAALIFLYPELFASV